MDSSEEAEATVVTDETDRLELIPLHSTDLLTVLDERGVVQYESPSIERLYGFDQAELVGQQVAAYFHPEDRERVVAAFERIVESDEHTVEAVEYRHRMADGSYRWIESVGSTNPTPDGNYVINSRDITERKERERELRAAKKRARTERDGKEAIRQLLLETSTDNEIADGACRLLVDSGYEGAWVVAHAGNGGTDPDVLAEAGPGVAFRTAEGDIDEATRRALETDDTVTITTEAAGDSQLCDRLAARGLAAVRSVPLDHDGISYGALTVVRTDMAGAEQLVEELAAALAFKQQVHRQQDALTAETVTELDIEIRNGHVLSALSATAPVAELAAEELQPTDSETVPYLVRTASGDAETLESTARELPAAHDVTRVTDGDHAVVTVHVDPPTVGTVLRGHGGVVQSMSAQNGSLSLTVTFPRQTDVGTAVDALQEHWPETTMQARTSRTVDGDQPSVFGTLTDKQEDALRAATLAGFFDRPQQASAADIAETLGVAESTFLYHLRNAEHDVFSTVFDSESVGD